MGFVDSRRAGKRVCVWLNKAGSCIRAVPVPPQKGPDEYRSLVADGKVMPAGVAVHLKYLTYAELKQMYPTFKTQQKTAVQSSQKNATKIKERTYLARWGLYDRTDTGKKSNYPYWKPLGDRG